jgi:DNA-binding MarR family transcriptional regulator
MPARLTLDDYLPYRLSVASMAVSRLISRAYESRFGLKVPEWRLVAVIAEAGALTQQAIVVRTAMDKVTVSRAAQALERRRLVERTPNEADARSHRLSLTSTGQALYEEVAPAALKLEAELLKDLKATDVGYLKTQLRRLEETAERLDQAME